MQIIAIDPGNEQSAFVEWDGQQILDKGIIENDILINNLNDKYVDENSCLVIEMIASYGMPVGKTVFDTCVWIGRFIEAWAIDYWLMYRKDVKMHLCSSMRAKDSNIRQALIDRFGKPGTKKNPNPVYNDSTEKMKSDIWAAFAVAVTFSDKIGENRRSEQPFKRP